MKDNKYLDDVAIEQILNVVDAIEGNTKDIYVLYSTLNFVRINLKVSEEIRNCFGKINFDFMGFEPLI